MICYGFTCRKIMVQSVYILNILTGQYTSIYVFADNKFCFCFFFLPEGGFFSLVSSSYCPSSQYFSCVGCEAVRGSYLTNCDTKIHIRGV